jgi:hypothetical protein
MRRSIILILTIFLFGPAGALAAGDAGGAAAAGANLYAAEPAPMTPDQCGQCHRQHYGDLKQNGGRHRFDCLNCHLVIHAYNPVRGNYADLMPKCTQCHTAPHGEKQVKCLTCHSNPHAAAVPPSLAQVKDICADCHARPAAELKGSPSKHTQQACQACHHDRHGYVPSCGECHQPHYPEQPMTSCTACHPVHRPLEIAFAPDTKADTCRQCHGAVVQKWSGTASKHGQVGCATCHTKHGLIPDCKSCHGTPHDAKQHAMFPRCLDCHLDVHDLPVKQKK